MVKCKKIVCSIMMFTMAVQTMSYGGITIHAAENADKKQYVIVAETDEVYNEVMEEVDKNITIDKPILSENNVIIAELTEDAAEIFKKNDIIVEEDIILTANTSDSEEDEYYTEKNSQKKAEIKRKRQERLELSEENSVIESETEYEWNLQAINVDGLDTEQPAEHRVKVAILDSGVDFVEGINIAGYVNFVDDPEEISPIFQDLTGHGTGIAGIISGNGETGIYGVAPNAELYSVKVLDEKNAAPVSRIIEGIYWCIEHDINIINMSFGTSAYSKALQHAIEDAYASNILMVGAAGNDGEKVEYPAAFEEVMAVAAVDSSSEISDFSNTGEELEIAAPGEKIRTTSFFNGSIVTHGTSMAVPHVTGVAALLWERDLKKSNEFIRQLIDYSAKDIKETDICGLLDAEHAMASYDSFSECFDEEKQAGESQHFENKEIPECFSYIEEDEAYVEGRWKGTQHKEAIDANSAGLSADAIALIKRGAVYPDKEESGWKAAELNPWFHGRWTKKGNTIEVNYAAAFEMVTEIAIEGMGILSDSSYDHTCIMGMDSQTFKTMKSLIKPLNKINDTVLAPYANTKVNRKYFLYGCGLHLMTDLFAHSTTKLNGTYLGHQYLYHDQTDDKDFHPTRYKIAVRAVQYGIENMQQGEFSDGEVIMKAVRDVYKETSEFKIINLKKYVNANGYSGSALNLANINSSAVVFKPRQ